MAADVLELWRLLVGQRQGGPAPDARVEDLFELAEHSLGRLTAAADLHAHRCGEWPPPSRDLPLFLWRNYTSTTVYLVRSARDVDVLRWLTIRLGIDLDEAEWEARLWVPLKALRWSLDEAHELAERPLRDTAPGHWDAPKLQPPQPPRTPVSQGDGYHATPAEQQDRWMRRRRG